MIDRTVTVYTRAIPLGGHPCNDHSFAVLIGAETPVHTPAGRRIIGKIAAAHVYGDRLLLTIAAPDAPA